MKNFHLEAHKYIGVPFKHRGRTMKGMDCLGVVVASAIACGYTKFAEFPYGREPDPDVVTTELRKHFGNPVADGPRINDVVQLYIGENPVHLGIITHHPYGMGVIHAYPEVRKVIYHGLNAKVLDQIAEVYRWAQ